MIFFEEDDMELRIGDVLSRAFSTWFDHFLAFLVLALVLTLPLLPLELAPHFMGAESAVWAGAAGAWLRVIVGYLITGVVVYTVFQSLKGESVSVMDSVTKVSSRLPSIVLAAISVSIMVLVGLLLLCVPGIILSLIFAVVVPVIVVEKLGVIDGLKRSHELTNGHKVNIFLTYLVYFVILFAVFFVTALVTMLLVGGAGAALDPDALASGGASNTMVIIASLFDHFTDALVLPLQATLTTVIYYDLRKMKDGTDLDEMLAGF